MNNTNSLTTKHSADILKFIMSVFVVATHTELFAPHLTPLVRLAVPVFFVLSGYFFFSKVNSLDNKKDKTAYLKKNVKHNLQLYAFWFVVLSPVTFYIRDYFNGGVTKGFLYLLHNFLLGSTFQASWYITALILGLSLVFFLSHRCNNFTLIVIGVLLYIPALLSSNYLFLPAANEATKEIYVAFTDIFLLPCRNFFVSIIYLVLGKVLAENGDSKKTKDGLISLVCFVLLTGEYLALYFGRVQIKNTDCFIMLPFAAYYLCRWVLSLEVKRSVPSALRKVSTLSYCMHMAVFMIMGKLAFSLDINDFGNIIVFALTLVATWSLSLVILKLEKLKLFGFLKYSH